MKRIKGMQIYVNRSYGVYQFVAQYPDGGVVASEWKSGNATTQDAINWWRNRGLPPKESMLNITYHCPQCRNVWFEEGESACDSDCPNCGLEDITAFDYMEPKDELRSAIERASPKLIKELALYIEEYLEECKDRGGYYTDGNIAEAIEAFGGGAEPYKPEPKYKPGFAEFLNSLLLERAE